MKFFCQLVTDITGTEGTIQRQLHGGDNQIKKNEMGRACGMYGGQERCIQSFGGKDTTSKT